MAGGIYTDKPFQINIKCVIFGMINSGAYLYIRDKNNPKSRISIMINVLIIIVISYILMAVYDKLYNCDTILKSGKANISFTSIFKPQHRKKNRNIHNENLIADQEKAYLRTVYFSHLFIAGTLIYTGFILPSSIQKNIIQNKKLTDTQSSIFNIVGTLGLLAGVYHGTRLKYPREVWK